MMTARVYWLGHDFDGEEGAWYWVETMETGDDFGERYGPFESALLAGVNARAAILQRAQDETPAQYEAVNHSPFQPPELVPIRPFDESVDSAEETP